MNNKKDDSDLDLTRIEDLPPLDHPPLPRLPDDPPPEFEIPEDIPDLQNDFQVLPEALPADSEIKLETEAEIEIETMPQFETTKTKTQIKSAPTITEEIFEDIKEQLETFVLKHVPFESYPSYSLYINHIQTGRQRNGIKLLLKEYNIFQSDQELELVNRSLQQKHLLIPRVSEFAAIFFANKLESLNLGIKVAPSEDLGTHHELWDQGPITQESFHHHLQEDGIIYPEIFISQSYSFSDKTVTLIGEVLQQLFKISQKDFIHLNQKNTISKYFNDLNELKEQARKINANGIVGINFQQIEHTDSDIILFLVTGEAAIVRDEI